MPCQLTMLSFRCYLYVLQYAIQNAGIAVDDSDFSFQKKSMCR